MDIIDKVKYYDRHLIAYIFLLMFIASILTYLVLLPLIKCLYKPFYDRIDAVNEKNYNEKGIFILISMGENFIFQKNVVNRLSTNVIVPGTNTGNENQDNVNINQMDNESVRQVSSFENRLSYKEIKERVSKIMKICCC